MKLRRGQGKASKGLRTFPSRPQFHRASHCDIADSLDCQHGFLAEDQRRETVDINNGFLPLADDHHR